MQYTCMPIVAVQTAIPREDYERFKQKAKDKGISEYALAQEALLIYINEPKTVQKKKVLFLVDMIMKDLHDMVTS